MAYKMDTRKKAYADMYINIADAIFAKILDGIISKDYMKTVDFRLRLSCRKGEQI